jgi:hypothetical protein
VGAAGDPVKDREVALVSIQTDVEVTVYCDGGYHPPLTFSLAFPTTQAHIRLEVRRRGWKVAADGKVTCPEHPEPRS